MEIQPQNAELGKIIIAVESQPQNPEFRNNPENFQPCKEISLDQFQAPR